MNIEIDLCHSGISEFEITDQKTYIGILLETNMSKIDIYIDRSLARKIKDKLNEVIKK